MELSHRPLLGGRGALRSPRTRASRRALSPYICHWMQLQKDLRITLRLGIQAHLSRSLVMSTRNGERAMTCKGLCEVHWSIEADIADGHLIFITGDPVTLGCWEPEMAVVLSPCTEHANLWKAEIKVPCGIHFKYNYFIKKKNQPCCGLVWRPGPEFSISIPLVSRENEVIVVRDSWMKTIIQRLPVPSWGSWLVDIELPDCHFNQGCHQISSAVD